VFESGIRNGRRKSFSLSDDLDLLGAATVRVGDAKLIIIDAITSYMGKIDSHRTTDVRAVLEPVAAFAEDCKVAIIGVTHPPKASQGNALRSFAGSFAFIAAPRVGLFVTAEPETDRRLLLGVKNNLGPKPRGIGYFIGTKSITNDITAPHILWSDAPVDYTADQAIAANAAAMKGKGKGDLEEAKEFLAELLKNGPVSAEDVKEAAEENDISEKTLRRAKKDLGIKSDKGEFRGGWQWRL
jgi:putative DNA primase/helicase